MLRNSSLTQWFNSVTVRKLMWDCQSIVKYLDNSCIDFQDFYIHGCLAISHSVFCLLSSLSVYSCQAPFQIFHLSHISSSSVQTGPETTSVDLSKQWSYHNYFDYLDLNTCKTNYSPFICTLWFLIAKFKCMWRLKWATHTSCMCGRHWKTAGRSSCDIKEQL